MLKRLLLALALVALAISPVVAQIGGGGTITANNVTPGYLNLDPALMQNWGNCLANAMSANVRCKLALVGDSTTRGIGAGGAGLNGSLSNQMDLQSYPTQLASMLAGQANPQLPVTTDSIWGTQWGAACGTNCDSRLNFAAGWNQSASVGVGTMFRNTTTTNTMVFTGQFLSDRCDVYSLVAPSGGSFNAFMDADAPTLITQTGTEALAKTTIVATTGVGMHTMNFARVAGTVNIIGWDCFNSVNPGISVMNIGSSGQTMIVGVTENSPATLVHAYSELNILDLIAPQMMIIGEGINDEVNNDNVAPISQAQYTTPYNLVISHQKAHSGDVIVLVENPTNPAASSNAISLATAAMFNGWQYAIASANNVPLVDVTHNWQSFAAANPLGWYFTANDVHPNVLGYGQIAGQVFRALALAGPNYQRSLFDLKSHLSFKGAVPVLSTCGGGSPAMTAGSSDTSGTFTVGTATATCTMTFGKAYTAAPFCVVNSRSTLAAFGYSVSNTALTVTATVLGGDVVDYFCSGA